MHCLTHGRTDQPSRLLCTSKYIPINTAIPPTAAVAAVWSVSSPGQCCVRHQSNRSEAAGLSVRSTLDSSALLQLCSVHSTHMIKKSTWYVCHCCVCCRRLFSESSTSTSDMYVRTALLRINNTYVRMCSLRRSGYLFMMYGGILPKDSSSW